MPDLDIPALRAKAEAVKPSGETFDVWLGEPSPTFDRDEIIALLDRLERAEATIEQLREITSAADSRSPYGGTQ